MGEGGGGPQCRMSLCPMSNLRKGRVTLSILGVKGHLFFIKLEVFVQLYTTNSYILNH